jgi:lipopolysaccharide/colanic/teichoic acid biosynthesis glycosyltransferase
VAGRDQSRVADRDQSRVADRDQSIVVDPDWVELRRIERERDHRARIPLLRVEPARLPVSLAAKHVGDRLVAVGVLLVLAPLLGAIALVIKLTMGSPILFRQTRIGVDGEEFEMFKFRTMSNDGDTAVQGPLQGRWNLPCGLAPGGVEGEDRRTRFGRLLRRRSLDELPQLINVLRGEMSLVGPRPERPEYVEKFISEIHRYGERHRVRTGITGLAQIRGLRGRTSLSDRIELDNYYIDNWSLWLDVKIMVRTVKVVLTDPPES